MQHCSAILMKVSRSSLNLNLPAMVLAAVTGFSGCASLQGPEYASYDPCENVNREIFTVSEWLDRNLLSPAARGYAFVTPSWLETGVLNFFANLRTVDSAVNGLLQGKPSDAATDAARVLINSTVGLAGLIDVAGAMGLEDQDEDLGQTVAVWGVSRTRYLYIPVLGPSTNRDAAGQLLHLLTPRILLGAYYNWWVFTLDFVALRADVLSATEARDAAALDSYVFTREAFYQRRKFQIFDGQPPMEDFFETEGIDE
jgi:phospholipid-binding lipoprotein MlaA